MRGGTSRGPYFLASDLPTDPALRDEVLIAAMGSGHELQVDGLGGGHALTSKVAIIGPPTREGADVDYLFAQVLVRERRVDISPNCGNMLAGVGPFALECGLVRATGDVTPVRIHNVNTQKIIEARIMTPNGVVRYDGDATIDGVPGSAAPIYLAFHNAAGSKTGHLLPTGSPIDLIDGVEVSCVDAAMPIMIVRAKDLGLTGYETPAELNANANFLKRLEALRLVAGARMGIENVADKVIPKPVLLAPPHAGGTVHARYFMPHDCHNALAVTGSVAIATAAITPGTIAHQIAGQHELPVNIGIEHPSGRIDIRMEISSDNGTPVAMAVRTARRIMEGTLIVNIPNQTAKPVAA